ncbi:inter-alpha-trypsin inhibitor heavy chain H3-like isoform X1 [Clarias gariepinus]|uniref:inter-alpha-trypsin inhibitor heavy chain H3-like isoform X1 n=1 Tax=Clarias gariepinus TaxID=13013 RepID=UPI00234DF44C|nr:inter-alpha-trypsin inhibitor heavy chain H3-like isoform X1 [Clarias gariepinus]
MERTTLVLTILGHLLLCVTSAPVKQQRDVDIYSFHINSTVNSRYAITVITSRVANRLNESKEIHFQVKIPKNAFISKFRMTIEGKTYDGVVKQKEAAQQQYSQAVSRGESAGIVSSVGRTLEDFKTSVTVAAFSKVTFELTYEELLKRRLGKYQLQINAQPMQVVADFKIDVYINEHPGISFLEIKGGLKTQELSSAVTSTLASSTKEAWVNFYPTREQQTKCEGCGENGLNGDLIIEYDVKRPKQNGELQASNGYFVHYFAPTDIQKIPKNVVFIIDRSGSMRGRKMDQTRTAMVKILGDLDQEDYFGLIIFDSSVDVWKAELLQATENNLNKAKDFVKDIQARGATDINAAVLKGVDMIKRYPREGSASILILLTDGDPTAGETNKGRIQENVKQAIDGKFPLYCLGFGFDVNFDFLEKMALENDGVARRIYEDSDADLQLQGFYEEVATPLLTDVQMSYNGASNLTQTSFRQYYNGSEIVVAGQITDNSVETLQTEVIAISIGSKVTYPDSVSTQDIIDVLPQHENFIQRLWAYLTVKQLLEKEVTLKGDEKEAANKKALDLSLKYEFVTPLTSMVVTKPQENEIQVAHKPKEGEEPRTDHHRVLAQLPPMTAGRPMGNPGLSIRQNPKGPPPKPNPPGLGYGYDFLRFADVQVFTDYQDSENSYSDAFPLLKGSAYRRVMPSQRQRQPSRPRLTEIHPISRPKGTIKEIHKSKCIVSYSHSGCCWSLLVLFTLSPSLIHTHTHTHKHTHTHSVSSVRFLISAQPKQICYDTPGDQKLRLLLDNSSDISINGQLSDKGFKLVVIHYKTATLNVSTATSVYSDQGKRVEFVWGQTEPSSLETDSVSIFLRSNELDVTMGSVRVVFLLHRKPEDVLLWPVIHQQPKNANTKGILGKKELQYEELSESKLKVHNQEVVSSRSSAIDYRFHAAPSVECWLVPFQSVLQGEISDFTVSQL